jgi:SSS family solute:Na+ symporter
MPITIGLLGRLRFAGLEDKAADNVISMLATNVGGDILGTLIITAGLAALMSTMDSQLLVLSSIFSRDILPIFTKKEQKTSLTGRFFVLGLALAGFLIAINPPATILKIVTWAFTGFAVLFPSVLLGLYLKNPNRIAAISSIIVGQILVFAYAMKWLPSFGFLPVIPIVLASFIIYMLIQAVSGSMRFIQVHPRNWWYLLAFALIFILAMDFWNWGKTSSLMLGLPSWVWYFVGLSVLQTIVIYYWIRKYLAPRVK